MKIKYFIFKALEHEPKNDKLSLFCKNFEAQYVLVCIFPVWHKIFLYWHFKAFV